MDFCKTIWGAFMKYIQKMSCSEIEQNNSHTDEALQHSTTTMVKSFVSVATGSYQWRTQKFCGGGGVQ